MREEWDFLGSILKKSSLICQVSTKGPSLALIALKEEIMRRSRGDKHMGSTSHSLQALLHGGIIPGTVNSMRKIAHRIVTHAYGMDLIIVLGVCCSVVDPAMIPLRKESCMSQ